MTKCGCILLTAIFFVSNLTLPSSVGAQGLPQMIANLPVGSMLHTTAAFKPVQMLGINIHPDNPLRFDFIIEKGDSGLEGEAYNQEATKLIKYFIAALAIEETEMWVNLSPYEKDRIIPEKFGQTEMGRDVLALDYMLKQLMSSLMYPEDELGQKFWKRVKEKAQAKFGTTDIPMNTFNKVWIVPETADIYEHEKGAFVVGSKLKVMLEKDYLAQQKGGPWSVVRDQPKNTTTEHRQQTTQVIREIIIPELEREVNEGETFANLRQIYNTVILASWYKTALKDSLLGQAFVNKYKTEGQNTNDPEVIQSIYDRYVEAFKKGVYNYIEEEYDPQTQSTIPRKYFSGGALLNPADKAALIGKQQALAQGFDAASINAHQFAANLGPSTDEASFTEDVPKKVFDAMELFKLYELGKYRAIKRAAPSSSFVQLELKENFRGSESWVNVDARRYRTIPEQTRNQIIEQLTAAVSDSAVVKTDVSGLIAPLQANFQEYEDDETFWLGEISSIIRRHIKDNAKARSLVFNAIKNKFLSSGGVDGQKIPINIILQALEDVIHDSDDNVDTAAITDEIVQSIATHVDRIITQKLKRKHQISKKRSSSITSASIAIIVSEHPELAQFDKKHIRHVLHDLLGGDAVGIVEKQVYRFEDVTSLTYKVQKLLGDDAVLPKAETPDDAAVQENKKTLNRLLLIEDDPIQLSQLKEMILLFFDNVEIAAASSVNEAKSISDREDKFDVTLSDFRLSSGDVFEDLDGRSAVGVLKHFDVLDEAKKSDLVIVHSSDVDDKVISNIEKVNRNAKVMIKDFSSASLPSYIKELLRHYKHSPGVSSYIESQLKDGKDTDEAATPADAAAMLEMDINDIPRIINLIKLIGEHLDKEIGLPENLLNHLDSLLKSDATMYEAADALALHNDYLSYDDAKAAIVSAILVVLFGLEDITVGSLFDYFTKKSSYQDILKQINFFGGAKISEFKLGQIFQRGEDIFRIDHETLDIVFVTKQERSAGSIAERAKEAKRELEKYATIMKPGIEYVGYNEGGEKYVFVREDSEEVKVTMTIFLVDNFDEDVSFEGPTFSAVSIDQLSSDDPIILADAVLRKETSRMEAGKTYRVVDEKDEEFGFERTRSAVNGKFFEDMITVVTPDGESLTERLPSALSFKERDLLHKILSDIDAAAFKPRPRQILVVRRNDEAHEDLPYVAWMRNNGFAVQEVTSIEALPILQEDLGQFGLVVIDDEPRIEEEYRQYYGREKLLADMKDHPGFSTLDVVVLQTRALSFVKLAGEHPNRPILSWTSVVLHNVDQEMQRLFKNWDDYKKPLLTLNGFSSSDRAAITEAETPGDAAAVTQETAAPGDATAIKPKKQLSRETLKFLMEAINGLLAEHKLNGKTHTVGLVLQTPPYNIHYGREHWTHHVPITAETSLLSIIYNLYDLGIAFSKQKRMFDSLPKDKREKLYALLKEESNGQTWEDIEQNFTDKRQKIRMAELFIELFGNKAGPFTTNNWHKIKIDDEGNILYIPEAFDRNSDSSEGAEQEYQLTTKAGELLAQFRKGHSRYGSYTHTFKITLDGFQGTTPEEFLSYITGEAEKKVKNVRGKHPHKKQLMQAINEDRREIKADFNELSYDEEFWVREIIQGTYTKPLVEVAEFLKKYGDGVAVETPHGEVILEINEGNHFRTHRATRYDRRSSNEFVNVVNVVIDPRKIKSERDLFRVLRFLFNRELKVSQYSNVQSEIVDFLLEHLTDDISTFFSESKNPLQTDFLDQEINVEAVVSLLNEGINKYEIIHNVTGTFLESLISFEINPDRQEVKFYRELPDFEPLNADGTENMSHLVKPTTYIVEIGSGGVTLRDIISSMAFFHRKSDQFSSQVYIIDRGEGLASSANEIDAKFVWGKSRLEEVFRSILEFRSQEIFNKLLLTSISEEKLYDQAAVTPQVISLKQKISGTYYKDTFLIVFSNQEASQKWEEAVSDNDFWEAVEQRYTDQDENGHLYISELTNETFSLFRKVEEDGTDPVATFYFSGSPEVVVHKNISKETKAKVAKVLSEALEDYAVLKAAEAPGDAAAMTPIELFFNTKKRITEESIKKWFGVMYGNVESLLGAKLAPRIFREVGNPIISYFRGKATLQQTVDWMVKTQNDYYSKHEIAEQEYKIDDRQAKAFIIANFIGIRYFSNKWLIKKMYNYVSIMQDKISSGTSLDFSRTKLIYLMNHNSSYEKLRRTEVSEQEAVLDLIEILLKNENYGKTLAEAAADYAVLDEAATPGDAAAVTKQAKASGDPKGITEDVEKKINMFEDLLGRLDKLQRIESVETTSTTITNGGYTFEIYKSNDGDHYLYISAEDERQKFLQEITLGTLYQAHWISNPAVVNTSVWNDENDRLEIRISDEFKQFKIVGVNTEEILQGVFGDPLIHNGKAYHTDLSKMKDWFILRHKLGDLGFERGFSERRKWGIESDKELNGRERLRIQNDTYYGDRESLDLYYLSETEDNLVLRLDTRVRGTEFKLPSFEKTEVELSVSKISYEHAYSYSRRWNIGEKTVQDEVDTESIPTLGYNNSEDGTMVELLVSSDFPPKLIEIIEGHGLEEDSHKFLNIVVKSDKKAVKPRPRKILIAEDDSFYVEQYKKVFEKLNFEVVRVKTGAEAWELLDQNPDEFGLVLTDQQMPPDGYNSGERLIGKMKADGRFSYLDVVMVSSSDSIELVRKIGRPLITKDTSYVKEDLETIARNFGDVTKPLYISYAGQEQYASSDRAALAQAATSDDAAVFDEESLNQFIDQFLAEYQPKPVLNRALILDDGSDDRTWQEQYILRKSFPNAVLELTDVRGQAQESIEQQPYDVVVANYDHKGVGLLFDIEEMDQEKRPKVVILRQFSEDKDLDQQVAEVVKSVNYVVVQKPIRGELQREMTYYQLMEKLFDAAGIDEIKISDFVNQSFQEVIGSADYLVLGQKHFSGKSMEEFENNYSLYLAGQLQAGDFKQRMESLLQENKDLIRFLRRYQTWFKQHRNDIKGFGVELAQSTLSQTLRNVAGNIDRMEREFKKVWPKKYRKMVRDIEITMADETMRLYRDGYIKGESIYPLENEEYKRLASKSFQERAKKDPSLEDIQELEITDENEPEWKWELLRERYIVDRILDMPKGSVIRVGPFHIKRIAKRLEEAGTKISAKIVVGDNASLEKGGIDLNPTMATTTIEKEGRGFQMAPVDPALLQQIQNAPGLIPVIINVSPIKNLPLLIGLADTDNAPIDQAGGDPLELGPARDPLARLEMNRI